MMNCTGKLSNLVFYAQSTDNSEKHYFALMPPHAMIQVMWLEGEEFCLFVCLFFNSTTGQTIRVRHKGFLFHNILSTVLVQKQ